MILELVATGGPLRLLYQNRSVELSSPVSRAAGPNDCAVCYKSSDSNRRQCPRGVRLGKYGITAKELVTSGEISVFAVVVIVVVVIVVVVVVVVGGRRFGDGNDTDICLRSSFVTRPTRCRCWCMSESRVDSFRP